MFLKNTEDLVDFIQIYVATLDILWKYQYLSKFGLDMQPKKSIFLFILPNGSWLCKNHTKMNSSHWFSKSWTQNIKKIFGSSFQNRNCLKLVCFLPQTEKWPQCSLNNRMVIGFKISYSEIDNSLIQNKGSLIGVTKLANTFYRSKLAFHR
jgi:hypothetical protein